MNNIYQVEFIAINNTNTEFLTKFYVTRDIGNVINSIKNDKDLNNFVISNIHNLNNSFEVKIL